MVQKKPHLVTSVHEDEDEMDNVLLIVVQWRSLVLTGMMMMIIV